MQIQIQFKDVIIMQTVSKKTDGNTAYSYMAEGTVIKTGQNMIIRVPSFVRFDGIHKGQQKRKFMPEIDFIVPKKHVKWM
jgi:hypothetical protein